jgi:adenosylhomocysteine nucleosidase
VPVFITGVGVERAKAVAERVLNENQPKRLILAGYGGALTLQLSVGDVIVARDVIDENHQLYSCNANSTGRVLTVNRMIATVEEKLSLGERYQATVCDMESTAVAEICRMRSVPFLAVRAISDSATRTLPAALDRIIVNGQVSVLRAIQKMIVQPKLVVEYYHLSCNTRIASLKLAETLKKIIDLNAHA